MVYKGIALFADRVLMIDVPYSVCTLACSKRSDSGERLGSISAVSRVRSSSPKRDGGWVRAHFPEQRLVIEPRERCEVKKAMKSRGGLEREVPSLTLSSIFSRSFLLRTAPHYLNARNWLFVHALWCFKILNTRVWLCTSLRAVHLSCHSKPALSLNFPIKTSCHFPSPAQK